MIGLKVRGNCSQHEQTLNAENATEKNDAVGLSNYRKPTVKNASGLKARLSDFRRIFPNNPENPTPATRIIEVLNGFYGAMIGLKVRGNCSQHEQTLSVKNVIENKKPAQLDSA